MSFDILKNHATIGWDVDGTLIENRASKRMFDFIKSTPEKRHCVVTFRTHDMISTLERDLAFFGIKDIGIFDEVYSVPPNVWLEWVLLQDKRQNKRMTGKLLLPEITYMEWKGFCCKKEGLSILVDDDLHNVKMGCDRYKIALIDSNKL